MVKRCLSFSMTVSYIEQLPHDLIHEYFHATNLHQCSFTCLRSSRRHISGMFRLSDICRRCSSILWLGSVFGTLIWLHLLFTGVVATQDIIGNATRVHCVVNAVKHDIEKYGESFALGLLFTMLCNASMVDIFHFTMVCLIFMDGWQLYTAQVCASCCNIASDIISLGLFVWAIAFLMGLGSALRTWRVRWRISQSMLLL